MRNFSQQTPDGRTIAADPDLRWHIAQPPPQHPAAGAADSRGGSDLVAFVAASIAALPELPQDSGSRLCLQVFLIGAGEAFWHLHRLPAAGLTDVLSRLLARYGLPGRETAALIEALPQLRQDRTGRRILRDGAWEMETFLGSHDRNVTLRIQQHLSDWRRERFCERAGIRSDASPAPT